MEAGEASGSSNWRKRQATLYDAVAGRVGYEGFLHTGDEARSKYRDTITKSNVAVPPEEVRFRRRGAPVRYEEDDIYAADRHLGPHQRLPDSDLVKTIHAYASDFYTSTASDDGRLDCKSLDETALLAMGILLEEAAAEAVGKTGDLALVEDDRGGLDSEDAASISAPSRVGDATLKRSVIERATSAGPGTSRSRSAKRQRSTRSRSNRSTSAG